MAAAGEMDAVGSASFELVAGLMKVASRVPTLLPSASQSGGQGAGHHVLSLHVDDQTHPARLGRRRRRTCGKS